MSWSSDADIDLDLDLPPAESTEEQQEQQDEQTEQTVAQQHQSDDSELHQSEEDANEDNPASTADGGMSSTVTADSVTEDQSHSQEESYEINPDELDDGWNNRANDDNSAAAAGEIGAEDAGVDDAEQSEQQPAATYEDEYVDPQDAFAAAAAASSSVSEPQYEEENAAGNADIDLPRHEHEDDALDMVDDGKYDHAEVEQHEAYDDLIPADSTAEESNGEVPVEQQYEDDFQQTEEPQPQEFEDDYNQQEQNRGFEGEPMTAEQQDAHEPALPPTDDIATSSSTATPGVLPTHPTSPSDRLLYDVFFHSPPFLPDVSEQDMSNAVALNENDMYDVTELEYLTHLESKRSALTNVHQSAKKQIQKVWWNCCSRKNRQKDEDEETDTGSEGESQQLDSPTSARDDSSASVRANWPILLSPNGDLLAVIKERSIVIRGSNHDFAFQELEFTIPSYQFLSSPYPSSLNSLAQTLAPHALNEGGEGSAHPFSRGHDRPVAWSARSELIAVAVREHEVAVYSVATLKLVHTLSFPDLVNPLQKQRDQASLAAAIPLQLQSRQNYPSIAGLVFREASCSSTPHGSCPHLIVLCYDGSVHHVHIPAVSREDSFALPSTFNSPATSVFAGVDGNALSLYPPHIPLVSSSSTAATPIEPVDPVPEAEQQLRQRGAATKGAAADALLDNEELKEGKSPTDRKTEPIVTSSKEYLTFLGVYSLHGGGSTESEDGSSSSEFANLVFTDMDFDAASQTLAISSITLTADRTPKVSLWRLSDFESPFLFPLITTQHTAILQPKAAPRSSNSLVRLLNFVKMSVGLVPVGAKDDSEPVEVVYTPSLLDVACTLKFSPNGSKMALLDRRGNLNIWSRDEEHSSCMIVDTHRVVDGCPTVNPSSASSVLLCGVSWWSDETLVCAYTNGHVILTPLTPLAIAAARPADALSPAFTAQSSHALFSSVLGSLRRNLLGQLPENVHGIPSLSQAIEPRPKVTATNNGGRKSISASPALGAGVAAPAPAVPTALLPHRIFLLECERRFLRKRKVWSSVGAGESEANLSFENSDAMDESTAGDDESLAIEQRRTFRLLSLCQSTPEEFLLRKVEAKQYEEALALAQVYQLHTDVIFKAQWSSNPVTSFSIDHFLSHISDTMWVLQQLVERLYDADCDVDTGRLLMSYGLNHMTSIETLEELRSISSEESSQVQSVLLAYRLLFLHYFDRLNTFATLHRCAPPSIALTHLTYSYFLDCDLIEAAKMLIEEEQFLAVQLLLQFHRQDLWLARHHILACIPESTSPMSYVKQLPMPGMSFEQFEAEICFNVDNLSAEIDVASPAHPINRPRRREADWIENIPLLAETLEQYQQASSSSNELPALSLDGDAPEELSALKLKLEYLQAIEAHKFEYDAATIQRFYLDRMNEIDAKSGLLNYATYLLEYAQNELKVRGLFESLSILCDLSKLIYTYQLEFLSLELYAPLDDFQRLCLVLRQTSPNTIVNDIQTRADMFFKRSSNDDTGMEVQDDQDPFKLSPSTPPLLRRYMLHIASTRLDLVHAIIMSSRPRIINGAIMPAVAAATAVGLNVPSPILIPNHADLISLALECCYSSSDSDLDAPDATSMKFLNQIFECLPQRSHSDDARIGFLHRCVDLFDRHLAATEILSKYGQGRALSFFLKLPLSNALSELTQWGPLKKAAEEMAFQHESWSNIHPSLRRSMQAPNLNMEKQCSDLLHAMARKLVKQKQPPVTDDDWRALLKDLLELRSDVFAFVPLKQIYLMFLQCTLAQERWNLTRDVLVSITQSPADAMATAKAPASPSSVAFVMTCGEAERLILDAAKEFFNSAPSLHHYALKQAESCLNILPLFPLPLVRSASEEAEGILPTSSVNQLSTPALSEEWQNELNLLAGLVRLDRLGGLNEIVPLEIRLAKERQDAARKAGQMPEEESFSPSNANAPQSVLELLLRVQPDLYTRAEDVLDLLRVLGSASDEAQIDNKLLLIQAAIHQDKHRSALKLVLNLMEQQPPSTPLQKEKASLLCYQLSQHLNFNVPAPNASSTASASIGLIKPKMHLLAHSMWSCTQDEQLNMYLDEFKKLSVKPITEEQLTSLAQRQSSPDSESELSQASPSPVASNESASPSASGSSFLDDDMEGAPQTDIERLILTAFEGESSEVSNAKKHLAADLMSITYLASKEGLESNDPDSDEKKSVLPAPAPQLVDSVLNDLIVQSCGVDNNLALSYLLTLSSPMSALPLLQFRLGEDAKSTAALPKYKPSVAVNPLNRDERQEAVELAMRFFSIIALLQEEYPASIIDSIKRKIVANSKNNQNASHAPVREHSSATSSITLKEWKVPSIDVLQDCSLDLLQSYIDALGQAYDEVTAQEEKEAVEQATTKPASLSSALHYNSIRLESKKTEYILIHCPNLDVVKFTTDPKYRLDSIMELARGNQKEDENEAPPQLNDKEEKKRSSHISPARITLPTAAESDNEDLSSAKMLEIALTLSKRYHVHPWELYMERTRALFLRQIPVGTLKSMIAAYANEQLYSNPILTYQSLVSNVWPKLSGTDLDRLSLLISLCCDCFEHIFQMYNSITTTFTSPSKKKNVVIYERNIARLREQKELLEKITSIASQNQQQQQQAAAQSSASPLKIRAVSPAPTMPVDYKLLLSSPASCMEELKKVLSEQNIFLVSRLCIKIQDLMRANQRGALFPLLNTAASINKGAAMNLAEIFVDSTPMSGANSVIAQPNFTDASSSSSPPPPAAAVIDSSLIFMVFLSKSLRQHIDSYVALSQASPRAGSSGSNVPSSATVSSWFTTYDKILKRLSVPHFVDLVTGAVYLGCDGEPAVNFSVNPSKAELQARLEAAQGGLRNIEQLPAWTGITQPPLVQQRSVSTDFDAAAAALPAETKAQLHDELVCAHTFVSILLGVFELQVFNNTSYWSEIVSSKGISSNLYHLLLDVVRRLSQSPLKARDVKKMLERIKVQKDSEEFKSSERQAQATADEQKYVWHLFQLVRSCLIEELSPARYKFAHRSMATIATREQLNSIHQICKLSTQSPTVNVSALLTAFSIHLNEENNIELFQLLLQFISGVNDETLSNESVDALQIARTKLLVLSSLDQLVQSSASAASVVVSSSEPLQSTLQEQLRSTVPLRKSLVQNLHTQALLIRCTQLTSPSSPISISKLADQFESKKTRAKAVEQALSLVPSSTSHSVECLETLAVVLERSVESDANCWYQWFEAVVQRNHWPLLLSYLPSLSELSSEHQRSIYEVSLANSDDKFVALQIGLSSTSDVNLSKLALQHTKAFYAQRDDDSESSDLQSEHRVLEFILRRGYLLDTTDCKPLFHALLQSIARNFANDESEEHVDVAIGSFAHSLALLVSQRMFSHAVSLFFEAHHTNAYLSDERTGLKGIRSYLQRAKIACQLAPQNEDTLELFRQSLVALITNELGSQ